MAEFGIPGDEVCVVPLGVDATGFGHRKESDVETCRKLGVAGPYFFSIATDFPHKNLPNLLDAYARLRARWRAGEPPSLVLAGHTSGANRFLSPTRIERTTCRCHIPGHGNPRAITSALPAGDGPGISVAI